MTTQPHYLYFAQWYHPKTDQIIPFAGTKVGISGRPQKRMKELGGGTIVNLESQIQYLFEFPTEKLAERTEKWIQEILKEEGLHDDGEWFSISGSKLFDEFADIIDRAGGSLTSIDELPEQVVTYSRASTSLLDNKAFWRELQKIVPDDLPHPREGDINKASSRVLSSMGKTNCHWEYRATQNGQSTIAISLMDVSVFTVNEIFEKNKIQTLKNLGYDVRVSENYTGQGCGALTIQLANSRNGQNTDLYTEMFKAMRDLVNTYKDIPWVQVNRKKV